MITKLLRQSHSFRLRRLMQRCSYGDFSYSLPIGNTDDVFTIIVFGGRYGGDIGRVDAATFQPTNSCHVMNLEVDPGYRKLGVAKNLLRLALKHSRQSELVPVCIQDNDARAFWAHVATVGDIQVRLGLLTKEVMALRSAMQPFRI